MYGSHLGPVYSSPPTSFGRALRTGLHEKSLNVSLPGIDHQLLICGGMLPVLHHWGACDTSDLLLCAFNEVVVGARDGPLRGHEENSLLARLETLFEFVSCF
jgi:hypothetical protein